MADGTTRPRRHPGLNLSPNPLDGPLKGGPPEQEQAWPGHDAGLRPHADHGEESYEGSGRLEGMRALITGGDSGIGRAVAIAFAREGADVAIGYYSEHDDANETMEWVEKAGRKAVAIDGDVQDPAQCRRLVERARQELGGLDILVNNAAIHIEHDDFLEIEPEQLERTFRTNIFGYIYMAQAAIRHMKEGACIINTGSVTGLGGHPQLIDYACTKAAIHNLTQSLAASLAERGIRVNCVAPGPVWTPLIASTRKREVVGKFGANTFWKRPAQPAEIAPTYVFLASADGRYYTGEVLCPSGLGTTTR